jgi:hypothetical protein
MIMTAYGKLGIAVLLALALVGVTSGQGWAGAVNFLVQIDDLTDTIGLSVVSQPPGVPTPSPTILPDSVGEFLHFTLPLQSPSLTSLTQSRALFEDVVGGTLSDQLLITQTAGSSLLNVQFASDPATLTLPPGTVILPGLVETGNFQTLADVSTPGGLFAFQVRSDLASSEHGDVPKPATLLLLSSGLTGLAGVAAWRRRRPSGDPR